MSGSGGTHHLEPLRPAVFLDRDGTLNEDSGYVHRYEDFRWLPGARDAIRRLNAAGVYVFVVTNQAGVAHGYYTEEHVHELHDWMQQKLQAGGAHIDAFEHSPFHPEGAVARYRRESELRKPEPGMLVKLQREWTTDHAGSFMVGDRDSDIQAAAAAGLPGYRFTGGSLLQFVKARAKPR